MSLNGKTCLIFGASSGIGAAVARRFGELGVDVVVHYNANRDGAEAVVNAIAAAGGKASHIGGDVSDGAVATSLVNEARDRLGRLDIVINNAGTMFGRTPIAGASDVQYRNVVDLNIGGVFFAARRAAQIMMDQKAGTIINTTSIAARTGGGDGAGLYGSAKGFVSTITRVLAKELAPHNIRVNAVAPGVIETNFHAVNSTPEQLAASLKGIPMGRLGTPDDCVGAYEFLANEAMSGYITGQVIEVNGGQLMP
ncbi:3-oxoacyl-[acyl-carrier-protein] reductase FabG [Hartmannibacter diazotrophicus]|uniref:3-oxoacyl-[acyl-carrier-protein] reductase FabG n=1 Tax=Hartmannibacter diazotrophicus TaxID=1482074 RepID=A0A2C9DB09_9HYPH|nr:SDR family oxidoreductase [Hartmannibacter diazotrophicus]SON57477.1 3-oxoacyl-[acyl-carrier-protein] reductase FabG [Hartmannibacter diazotrophicus]